MTARFSVRAMAARARERFLVPLVCCGLAFAAAMAARWLHVGQANDELLQGTYDATALTVCEALLCGLCFSVAGTLLAEALNRARLRGWLALAGLCAGGGLFGLFTGFRVDAAVCAGLCLTAVLLCAALLAGRGRPQETLGRALGCLCLSAAVALLIFLVLLLLIATFFSLFLQDESWYIRSCVNESAGFFAALVAGPFLLFGLLPDENTPRAKFSGLRKVLAFVILPAFLALLIVLLGYIAAILVKRELPAGRINPCALLALGAFAALHLLLTGEENRLSGLFVKHGAWLLLPVIIAQGIAVYIRVDAYGLTRARIEGLALTACCLIPVGAALLRRYGRAFFLTGAILVFVLSVTPLSAETLARLNQEGRLYSALERAGMLRGGGIVPGEGVSGQDQAVIWDSAYYLYGQIDGRAPEGSRTAELIRQVNAQADDPQAAYAARAARLFGFDSPRRSYRYTEAKGPWTARELDVSGFAHAKYCQAELKEETGWQAELDGETITLDMLLPCADFDSLTLTRTDLPLDSGRTLRIVYIGRIENPPYVYYSVAAWVMTPEADALPGPSAP